MPKALIRLNHPLDGIFSASSHIAVLRALQHSKEGMSGRAIARAAGINPQSCVNAVRNLEARALLLRHGTGHSQLIELNQDNYIVKELLLPLLKKERDFFRAFEADVLHILTGDMARGTRPYAKSATIFGSFARRENRPDSDLDLLIIVENQKAKEALQEQLSEFQFTFKQKYGLRFAPIALTPQEAKSRLKKNDPLMKNILKEGQDIMSPTLKEVLA